MPSVQVFAFTDTIPFHLQLNGPKKSLLKLLGIYTIAGITGAQSLPTPTPGLPSTSQKVASAIRNPSSLLSSLPQRGKDKDKVKESDDEKKLSVKVIMRGHITVTLMGQVVAKTLVLGEAKLSAPSQSSADPQAAAFDWEGSLCVGPDKTAAGSFAVGGIQVKVRRVCSSPCVRLVVLIVLGGRRTPSSFRSARTITRSRLSLSTNTLIRYNWCQTRMKIQRFFQSIREAVGDAVAQYLHTHQRTTNFTATVIFCLCAFHVNLVYV